jgi:predicted enzyme related to lactoylglutathione lyase
MTPNLSPGDPNWIELFTTDTDRARSFYGDLFGWEASESGPEYGGYITFERDGAPIAGCMKNDGSGGPSTWTVYLASEDVAKTAELAKQHGGQVVFEPMQVGDMGYMCLVIDPAGAAVGVWQPLEHRGFSARGEVGAPSWFETLSQDYDRAMPFYRDVFGWDVHTMSDTPEFRYTTHGLNDQARAGIMDGSAFLGDQPSRWQFYLEVADTDATVARAEAMGGTVVQPAEDTPYGRVALLKDPEGVPFSVMSSRPS